jgi:hypothetical protein
MSKCTYSPPPVRLLSRNSPLITYSIAATPCPFSFCIGFSLSCSTTRQAVSVWIKNRVASSYSTEPARAGPDHKPISPADRSALKSNILPLLAASPSRAITVQLASTLKTLISNDFPERWPELLDGAKALLTSNSIREVGAGTVVVLEMVRAFRCAPSFACFLPVAS